MAETRIPMEQWGEKLRQGMVHFLNYYLSGGPLERLIDGAGAAVDLAALHMPFEAAAAYRQRLGGIFTDAEELAELPVSAPEALERLAALVAGLDLAKLDALVPRTTRRNRVEAYVNGPDNLRVLLEEIAAAERYIHLSVMLFFNDNSGNRVTDALLAALARGVQVRVMVDFGITALGYAHNLGHGDFGSLAEKLEAAGGRVVNTFNTCYPASDWPDKRAALAERGVSEQSLFLQDFVQAQIVTDLNTVNHRKFMVVDGMSAVLGSINIGDQYTYDTPIDRPGPGVEVNGCPMGVPAGEDEWHDGCVRIRGEAAGSLNEIFAFQWTVLGGDVFDPRDGFYYPEADRDLGEEACTLFASFPGNPVNLIRDYYLSMLAYAGDETIIVNPYLIDQAFWDGLKALDEERARHITLCNPLHVNDHPTNLAAVRGNMYEPFGKGVRLFDYSRTGRFSHWKITWDKRAACVFHGSYNINERSARHDFELGLLVQSKPFADKVKRMLDYDLGVSEEVTDAHAFFKHPALHPSTYLNKLTKDFT